MMVDEEPLPPLQRYELLISDEDGEVIVVELTDEEAVDLVWKIIEAYRARHLQVSS